MTVTSSINAGRLLEQQLAQASPGLLRELLTTFFNTLMSAEADAVCAAAYGAVSPERVNRRNGYRAALAEEHDEWAEGRRYLGLDVLARSRTITDEEASDELSLQALTA